MPSGINFFSADFLDNPYPYYQQMRSDSPLMPHLGLRGNDWILTRYTDIRTVLSSKDFSVDNVPNTILHSGSEQGHDDRARLSKNVRCWLFFVDPPVHTRMRSGVARAFSRQQVEQWQAEADNLLEQLLADFRGQTELDVMTDIAVPMTTRLMLRFLGIKNVDDQQVSHWASKIFSVFQQPISAQRYAELGQVLAKLELLLEQVITQSDRHLVSEGFLARLLANDQAELVWPAEQLLAFVTMLLSVGRDTTKNLIGNSLLAISMAPAAWDCLSNEHALLDKAVDELARYDTPVQLIVRVAKQDTVLAEQTIKAGERMHLFLGAGLRDPAVFVNPDQIDFERNMTGNLPFGAGPHYCLGAYIARLAARTVLQRLVKPGSSCPVLLTDQSVRERGVHLRGFAHLPMRFSQPI